ncbi:MAG: hypothetical protein ACYC69_18085 [Thermodesulfovibrionales bacterium]
MKKAIIYFLLGCIALSAITWVILDRYPPSRGTPFIVQLGLGGVSSYGGPIKAGQDFLVSVDVSTDYKLENITVKFEIPKQVLIRHKDGDVIKNLRPHSYKIVHSIGLKGKRLINPIYR